MISTSVIRFVIIISNSSRDQPLSCQDGDTALSHACCCGHQDIVTALLCSPLLNINTTDTDRVTPLHKAIANNHVDIVVLLLKQPLLEVILSDPSRVSLSSPPRSMLRINTVSRR